MSGTAGKGNRTDKEERRQVEECNRRNRYHEYNDTSTRISPKRSAKALRPHLASWPCGLLRHIFCHGAVIYPSMKIDAYPSSIYIFGTSPTNPLTTLVIN